MVWLLPFSQCVERECPLYSWELEDVVSFKDLPQTCALLLGIVDYMVEQSGPPSKEILTLKQVQEFLKDGDDVVILGVFQGDGDPGYLQYQDAGEYGPARLLSLWGSRMFLHKISIIVEFLFSVLEVLDSKCSTQKHKSS